MADINPNALLEFAKTITSGGQSKGGARLATVTRVDESGTAYVQLPGGNETPIATTGAAYNIGDVVSVSMYGGKLRTVDNISAPSVSERIVRAAVKPVSKAADLAKKAASEAEAVATAINQHFWDDTNGAHVTDVTKDEWAKAVADGFSDLSSSKQYSNLLLNSLGILIRSALNNLVSITRSTIAFYDGLGNNTSNIVASFGVNGMQVGKNSAGNVRTTSNSVDFYNATTKMFSMGNLTTPDNVSTRGIDLDPATSNINALYADSSSTSEFSSLWTKVGNYQALVDVASGSSYSEARIEAKSASKTVSVGLDPNDGAWVSAGSASIGASTDGKVYSTGILEAMDGIRSGGHSSSIGTVAESDGDEVSTTSGTARNLTSIQLAAGTWALIGGASFQANTSGRRLLCFNTDSATATSATARNNGMSVGAAPSGQTYLKAVHIANPTSTTRFYLVAEQNSGSSLAAEGFIRAVRIA